jgi:hypothetical protein
MNRCASCRTPRRQGGPRRTRGKAAAQAMGFAAVPTGVMANGWGFRP